MPERSDKHQCDIVPVFQGPTIYWEMAIVGSVGRPPEMKANPRNVHFQEVSSLPQHSEYHPGVWCKFSTKGLLAW